MLMEYLNALFFIFVAEMGDKTQILAMMFATKYKMSKVLLGVLIGSFLNHGMAVLFGSLIGGVIPENVLQIIAGSAFIFFALWGLKEEDDEEEEKTSKKLGPVFTVAAAFFIGELADKTQLTAITLAVNADYPFIVLLGTVSGMLLTSSLGIIIGSKLGDKIPELALKMISFGVFLIFGTLKLYTAIPSQYINFYSISAFILFISISSVLLCRPILERRKKGEKSLYLKIASSLQEYMKQMKDNIDDICLGENQCGKCLKEGCIIGYTREIIQEGMEDKEPCLEEAVHIEQFSMEKHFDETKLIESLCCTFRYLLDNYDDEHKRNIANAIRNNLELALFGEALEFNGDEESYLEQIKEKDISTWELILKSFQSV